MSNLKLFYKNLKKNFGNHEIFLSDLQLEEKVLQGKVYTQKGYFNGNKIIVKWIDFSSEIAIENGIFNEINGLIHFQQHKNIVRFFGFILPKPLAQLRRDNIYPSSDGLETHRIGLILEHAPFGSISDYLSKQFNQISFEHRIRWCLQLCQIITYFHKENFVHHDIKPGNILLFEDDAIKLCDFELSTKIDNEMITKPFYGTIPFSAPETYRKIDENTTKGQYTFNSEIYSIGITITSILTGWNPPSGDSPTNFINDAIRKSRNYDSGICLIPEIYQERILTILLSCIDGSPSKRISLNKIEYELKDILELEKMRLFQNQDNRRQPKEIDFFVHLVRNSKLAGFNFFNITFEPNQGNINFLEYANDANDIELIKFYLNHKDTKTDTLEFKKNVNNSFKVALEKGYKNIYQFWIDSPYQQYIEQETLQNLFLDAVFRENISTIRIIFNFADKLNFPIKDILKAKDEVDQNAFMITCQKRNQKSLEILEFLLSFNFDLTLVNKYGMDVFLLSALYGNDESMELLIKWNSYPIRDNLNKRDYFDNNALMLACTIGHISTIKYLIEDLGFQDLTSTNKYGNDVFMIACKEGHLDIIQYIISKGFKNFYLKNKEGRNGFMLACQRGFDKVVIYLIEEPKCSFHYEGANHEDGIKAFMDACMNGNVNVIKYLLEKGLWPSKIINTKDYSGNTAIIYACAYGKLELTKYLIENTSCDINLTQNEGLTPFHSACLLGQVNVIEYLIGNSRKDLRYTNLDFRDPKGNNGFMIACKSGHFKVIKYLIENEICRFRYLSAVNEDGFNAFMLASLNKDCEIIKYLIEIKPCPFQDIHKKSNSEYNALMLASSKGNIEVVKYLLNNENCPFTDILAVNNEKMNIIMIACAQGNLEIVQYLLENNVFPRDHINDQDLYGYTAIQSAIRFNQIDIVTYLLENTSCDLNIFNKKRINSLMMACITDDVKMVQLILENSIRTFDKNIINVKGFKGFTALKVACYHNLINIVKYLLENYPNCDNIALDDGDQNLLMTAVSRGYLDTVKYLIEERNYSLYEIDKGGNNVFMLACNFGRFDIVKYLIEKIHYQQITKLNYDKSNAFLLACQEGHVDIVKYLLEQMIFTSETLHLQTALNYASYQGRFLMIKYLIEIPILPFKQIAADCFMKGFWAFLNDQEMDAGKGSPEYNHGEIIIYLIDQKLLALEYFISHPMFILPMYKYAYGNNQLSLFQFCLNNLSNFLSPNHIIDSYFLFCKYGFTSLIDYLIQNSNSSFDLIHKTQVIDKVKQLPEKKLEGWEIACQHNHFDIAIFLLKQYATNQNVEKWLTIAIEKDYLPIIKYLIEENIINLTHLKKKDTQGNNVFMQVCRFGHISMVKYLMENSICSYHNISEVNEKGENAFILACMFGHLPVVEYLISCPDATSENIFHKEKNGRNALILACLLKRAKIVEYLIENARYSFADSLYDEIDNLGNNVFMYACQINCLPIVQFLCENSTKYFSYFSRRNQKGKNCLDLAANHVDIVEYLQTQPRCASLFGGQDIS